MDDEKSKFWTKYYLISAFLSCNHKIIKVCTTLESSEALTLPNYVPTLVLTTNQSYRRMLKVASRLRCFWNCIVSVAKHTLQQLVCCCTTIVQITKPYFVLFAYTLSRNCYSWLGKCLEICSMNILVTLLCITYLLSWFCEWWTPRGSFLFMFWVCGICPILLHNCVICGWLLSFRSLLINSIIERLVVFFTHCTFPLHNHRYANKGIRKRYSCYLKVTFIIIML